LPDKPQHIEGAFGRLFLLRLRSGERRTGRSPDGPLTAANRPLRLIDVNATAAGGQHASWYRAMRIANRGSQPPPAIRSSRSVSHGASR